MSFLGSSFHRDFFVVGNKILGLCGRILFIHCGVFTYFYLLYFLVQANPGIQFVMWTRDKHLLEPYETEGFAGKLLNRSTLMILVLITSSLNLINVLIYLFFKLFSSQ